MIRLGKETLIQSRASFHDDQELNKRQAALLFKDYHATRNKRITEALHQRFPKTKGVLEVREDDQGLHWVVFKPAGARDKRGEALAVMTLPKTRIEKCYVVLEWHWCPVGGDKN